MKKLIPVLLFITIAPIAQGYEKKLMIPRYYPILKRKFMLRVSMINQKKVNEVPSCNQYFAHPVRYTNISPTHLSEALNGISGVNIHRGSGQEHLTSIRSPVLTGGSGAGSFLYMEDGVPLRSCRFFKRKRIV